MEITAEINFGSEEVKGSQEYIDKYFSIVKASKLSLRDEMFKHKPKSYNQKVFKDCIFEVLRCGMRDFRAQRIDPSINSKGEIYFCKGMQPALGISAKDWKELAEAFMPERKSRLGYLNERIAFIAVMMKNLESSGYEIEEIWKMVCDDSRNLGNYKKLFKSNLQMTGSMEVYGWSDLSNTQKIIMLNDECKYEPTFCCSGGDYKSKSKERPLSITSNIFNLKDLENSVGWIVLDV